MCEDVFDISDEAVSFPADDGGTLKDAYLVRMFLMMQPWYIPSTDMGKNLVLKYPSMLLCHKYL